MGLRNITDNTEHHSDFLFRGGVNQVPCLLIETEKLQTVAV